MLVENYFQLMLLFTIQSLTWVTIILTIEKLVVFMGVKIVDYKRH